MPAVPGSWQYALLFDRPSPRMPARANRARDFSKVDTAANSSGTAARRRGSRDVPRQVGGVTSARGRCFPASSRHGTLARWGSRHRYCETNFEHDRRCRPNAALSRTARYARTAWFAASGVYRSQPGTAPTHLNDRGNGCNRRNSPSPARPTKVGCLNGRRPFGFGRSASRSRELMIKMPRTSNGEERIGCCQARNQDPPSAR